MKGKDQKPAKRVDFFAWRPISNATSRCRGELYIKDLAKHGWHLRFLPPAPDKVFYVLNDVKGPFRVLVKLVCLIFVFVARLIQIISARNADVVVIQRELFPVGPPFFETILWCINPKIIYDFDDVIDINPPYIKKCFCSFYKKSKFRKIIALSRHLLPSTQNLAARCSGYGVPITVIPTPVDIEKFEGVEQVQDHFSPAIGWVGTGGNQYYLQALVPVLRTVQERYRCAIVVVSEYGFVADGIDVTNFRWSLPEEASIMARFQIGIMPLENTEYSQGKAGYKILQYWAAGLPVIASPVGFNTTLIEHGKDGFLAETEEEWVYFLSLLLEDPALRIKLGNAGRRKVKEKFSPMVLAGSFLEALGGVASGRN
jgi:glycosyltransferase involved in cell wall biosynthesis